MIDCVFYSFQKKCKLLIDTECDGTKTCSFYKTREQFEMADFQRIEHNRQKGLCDECPYGQAEAKKCDKIYRNIRG